MLQAREAERRALTHTLQEEVGQGLAALAVRLRLAQNACVSEQCESLLNDARTLVNDTLHRVEELTRELYPPALESQGIVPALEVLANDFAKMAQVRVELDLEVLPYRLHPELEIALFRVAQEVLENIQRYAYASSARMILREQGEGCLYLRIEDNGCGIAPEVMQDWKSQPLSERAEALGGSCLVQAMPGQGTRCEVWLPLDWQEAG